MGISLEHTDIIHLALDELETLHLCDGEGKSQIEAGTCMGVSRGTVQRLLASARCKVAHALVGQKALAISGNVPEKEKVTGSGEDTNRDKADYMKESLEGSPEEVCKWLVN